MIAYNEMVELINRFLKLFQWCSIRDRLAVQLNMIALAKAVKRFVSQLLSGSTDPNVFRKAREENHTQEEKIMLHEVFASLRTSRPVPG